MDGERARERLEELLRELDGSVATLERESPGDDAGELAHYDQHPADAASEISDADREIAVIEAARAQRQQVVEALARVADGSYGTCIDCGTQLPDERLDARPEASRCLDCQRKTEGGR